MVKERKIEKVFKKMSFADAENADDEFWAQATVEERLKELMHLRKMFFGNAGIKIKKSVSQRSMYDDEN